VWIEYPVSKPTKLSFEHRFETVMVVSDSNLTAGLKRRGHGLLDLARLCRSGFCGIVLLFWISSRSGYGLAGIDVRRQDIRRMTDYQLRPKGRDGDAGLVRLVSKTLNWL